MDRLSRFGQMLGRFKPLTWLAIALGLIAGAAIAIDATTSILEAWTPNIATDAIFLLVTIVVVERLLTGKKREDERARVEQALSRISGDLHMLTDGLWGDYKQMHQPPYERPPEDFRGLLAFWKRGLTTRDLPWPLEPWTLIMTKSLSGRVEQQIERHGTVLEHAFIAAGYAFMRSEAMGRNMYLDRTVRYNLDRRKLTALDTVCDDVIRLFDVYEPYARRYLGRDWRVRVRIDEIDFMDDDELDAEAARGDNG